MGFEKFFIRKVSSTSPDLARRLLVISGGEEMTFSEDSPPEQELSEDSQQQELSIWDDFTKRYFRKRYLCGLLLGAILPFVVLKLWFMIELPNFSFLKTPSNPFSPHYGKHVPKEELPTILASAPAPGETFIRPDEDAWRTHDEWIKHGSHGPDPSGRENSTEIVGDFSPITTKGDAVGLPEDNDKEEVEYEREKEEEKQMEEQAEPDDRGNATQTSIRPDEDAWRTHDEWIKHGSHGPDPSGRENSTAFRGPLPLMTTEGENVGLPEDNEVLEVEYEREVEHEKEVAEVAKMASPDEQGNATLKAPEEKVDKKDEKAPDSHEMNEITPADDGECDLFEGIWDRDPKGPVYTNNTCAFITVDQDCQSNGRPDTEYLYWRWKPTDCDLPNFDAQFFLESHRGKAVGFLGDSIARNQVQSMLCLLSQVEMPVEIMHKDDWQTFRWLFKDHQFMMSVVWAPYLLKESKDGDMGFEEGTSVLYLDQLDPNWTSVMNDFDVLIFLTGQWFYKSSVYVKNNEVVGCHYLPDSNITETGFYEPYRDAIRLTLEKVSNDYKGIAIMATFPIAHFENGDWDTGGTCDRQMPLLKLESEIFPGLHMVMRDIVVTEFNAVVSENKKQQKDAKLELLDVTKVGLQRADGHPGRYRRPPDYPRDPDVYYANDCLHWCLPGPIEAWNQLVQAIVAKYM